MSILESLKKNSTIKETDVLSDSTLFNEKDMITTEVPMINVALSGSLEGGLAPGITTIAGPSRYFKSNFALLLAKAYLSKYPKDGAILLYDTEFGTPKSYFDAFKIDMDKVIHTPVTDVEVLKHDIMTQLASIKKGDHVIIVIDSLGTLASKKEVDDALEGKSVADMTRAKALKSLFRMVTIHLRLKDIPMIVVNHTYKEIGLYPKDIMGGGTGLMNNSDTVWFMGRQQEKDGTELQGYNFIINVEKSRFVREKSRIPISVTFDGGIATYSGLLETALESGHVTKPLVGWYLKKGDTKKVREADTLTKEFWESILEEVEFQNFVKKKYEVAYGDILKTCTVVADETDGE